MSDPNDSGNMPDQFDRLLGLLDGLPDVTRTRPATLRVIPPLGVGGSQLFVVQTYRQREQGDTIFLECATAGGNIRLTLPPEISNVIARQREQLTGKVRSKAAKRVAQDRKDRGLKPAFMKNKK